MTGDSMLALAVEALNVEQRECMMFAIAVNFSSEFE
jgi:hypothetical protein